MPILEDMNVLPIHPSMEVDETPLVAINEHGVVVRTPPGSLSFLAGAYACIPLNGDKLKILSRDEQNLLPSTYLNITFIENELPSQPLHKGAFNVVFR